MRVGIFADVHGNLPALQAVIADGLNWRVDRWMCLGDLAFRGPAPAECIALVSKMDNVMALMGNTEEWLPSGPPADEGDTPARRAAIRRWWEWTIRLLPAEAVEWVEHLPRRLLLEHGKVRLLGVHATARGLEDRLTPWAADDQFAAAVETATHTAIACAHIHTPYLRRVGGALVFNTGSTGRPIDGDPRASYVLADVEPDGIASLIFRRVTYDIDATARLCIERDFPWTDEYINALRIGANF